MVVYGGEQVAARQAQPRTAHPLQRKLGILESQRQMRNAKIGEYLDGEADARLPVEADDLRRLHDALRLAEVELCD